MNIRTAEQLYDAIAADFIWRKKELSAYKFAVEGAGHSPDKQHAFLRGAIALLYAHWEGFIKFTGGSYLEFVYFQRLKHSELAPNFIALSARRLLRDGSQSSAISAHLRITEFYRDQMESRSSIPYRDAIATRSNLSSRVLREILEVLGLDTAPFATKAVLIDELLVDRRNSVAHGEYLLVTLDGFHHISSEVLAMMDEFFMQVSNAAAVRRYRNRSASSVV